MFLLSPFPRTWTIVIVVCVQDVFEVKFNPNKAYTVNPSSDKGVDGFVSPYDCPITGRPVNGVNAYVFSACSLASSGCSALMRHLGFLPSKHVVMSSLRRGSARLRRPRSSSVPFALEPTPNTTWSSSILPPNYKKSSATAYCQYKKRGEKVIRNEKRSR